ncbi:unnamed protein product [Closterium sp. NIES-65]|nr:unnamed protein product [Closterium sp. NIES-65]
MGVVISVCTTWNGISYECSLTPHGKTFKRPRRPFEKERLDAELKLLGEYGLRCKRELWRVQYVLSRIRKNARELLTLDEKSTRRIFEGEALLRRMHRYGLLEESQNKLDYVLALTVENFLERRLQTLVFKTGLAKSIHHARVLIRQRHIRVGKQIVNIPSFLVRLESQKHIDFALTSPFGGGRPGRVKRRNLKAASKKGDSPVCMLAFSPQAPSVRLTFSLSSPSTPCLVRAVSARVHMRLAPSCMRCAVASVLHPQSTLPLSPFLFSSAASLFYNLLFRPLCPSLFVSREPLQYEAPFFTPRLPLSPLQCTEECRKFLSNYRDAEGIFKYMRLLQDVADRKLHVINIHMADLVAYGGGSNDDLVARIYSNARRYITLFAEAADDLMPEPSLAGGGEEREEDVYDVLMRQRAEQHAENLAQGDAAVAAVDPLFQLPALLRRRFDLHLVPEPKRKAQAIREVGAGQIGRLVVVKGIVTRCTDVKPLLQVATYTCDECGFEIYQEVTARTFMPLFECPSTRCRTNNARGRLHLHTRGSKFQKFQEARIQELAEQVPKGHVPRAMTVQIRGDLTRQVSPGDVVSVAGVFLPVPFVGFKAMRAGLTADTYLEAMSFHHSKKRFSEYASEQTPEEAAAVQQLAAQGSSDVYSRLARSIAPEIYGHDDVKKVLLLLLVGAPTRSLPDGMKIRGDVHVCLMGDPGVAKSQLLKHIVTVAPRGVYTTGKGSSGVGLTAAVTRDTVTGEMVLEGGALVLADMGICAIDEFDKMDENDRTAIHEVMEQQTVSIAKAGITTSLNARTAVLAAANPAWGRYDMRRTPAENINLPPALLSRFDILWLMLDRADVDADLALARHVLHVHQHSAPPALDFDPVDPTLLRNFIATARTYEPSVPEELTDFIASAYAGLRQEEAASDAPHTYTTARTLLSILRLAEARARLRLAGAVAQSDVEEALRLMHGSKASLQTEARQRAGLDAISAVYSIVRDEAARARCTVVSYSDALNWITRKGHSEAELRECLEDYAELNVWQIDQDSLTIRFIDS